MAFDFIATQLKQRKEDGLYRQSRITQNKQGRYIDIAGKRYLNFSSNDYLGLASDNALISAWQEGANKYGVGSGGAYLVTGYNQAHHELSEQLKSWLGVDAIALFSSGYSANQAIIKLLLDKHSLLLQDKLNHASLMEAGSLSASKMLRFRHNDVEHLSSLLAKHQNSNTLTITEGVFSMDGDQAPITELLTKTKQHNSWLMVDDAHGLGVLGKDGQGSLAENGEKNNSVQILMATFGKALGVGGAFVAGSQDFIDYLNNFSKPYIYTTGLPPAMAYTISCAAKIAETEQWRRDKLFDLISLFKQLAQQKGVVLSESQTAIQPLIIGDSKKAISIAHKLQNMGFWVTAIRPPTVLVGTARLRITLTTSHEKQDISDLINAISTILSEY
jgi:8-amino-7-oxononanoate synthase